MINRKNVFVLSFFLFFVVTAVRAMVYDNRYFPLYEHIFPRTELKPSIFYADVFFMTAKDAAKDTDDSIGIPEVWGNYCLNALANGIVALGRPHPFIGTQFAFLIGREIPYFMAGKIQAEGVSFAYHQRLTDNVAFGATWFGMHVFSRINFELNNATLDLTQEQVIDLDQLRRSMQESVGLEAPKFSKAGFSDIDMYLSFGNIWHYKHKFRRIDAAVRAGVLIPTGLTRDINNPASLPFGGNGHWGAYVSGVVELELREDWMVGCIGRLSKRFEKSKRVRFPLADEQPLFAVLPAEGLVDSGLTAIVVPYLRIEDIRDGLGIQAKYPIVHHFDDCFSDNRFGPKVPEVQLGALNKFSQWTAEYLALSVFYDFSRVRIDKLYAPIFSFTWDIPIQFFLTERSSKTSRISLGIAFGF